MMQKNLPVTDLTDLTHQSYANNARAALGIK